MNFPFQDLSEFIRSLVRPTITVGIVASLILFTWHDKLDPQILADLGIAVSAFWFGGRVQDKLNGK